METSITSQQTGTLAHYLLRTRTDFARILIDPANNLVLCYSSCGNYNFSWHAPGEDFTAFLGMLPFDYAMSKFLGNPTVLDVDRSAKIMFEHIYEYRRDGTYSAEQAREMWKAVTEAAKYNADEFVGQIAGSAFGYQVGAGKWPDYLSYFHGHQAAHFWNLFWRPLMDHLAANPAPQPRPAYAPGSNSPLAPIYESLAHIERVLDDAGLMPAAAPAPDYATAAQKEEIIRLLNLPPVSRPEKTRALLNINRFTAAEAEQKLAELRTATGQDQPQPAA